MNNNKVFELESENLSNVGGPMGNNSSSTNWTRLFYDKEKAKMFAELDYKKNNGKEKIEWANDRSGGCRSQDLRWVMYNITSLRVYD